MRSVVTGTAALVTLGFALGLDSFRVSIGLGATEQRPTRQMRIAMAFGAFDALALLLGLKIGSSFIDRFGPFLQYLGALMVAAYGIYVLYLGARALQHNSETDESWIVFGLPLSLSLDNLIAGIALGSLNYAAVGSALVIGVISGSMAWCGLRLGGVLGRVLPLRTQMVTGFALIVVAVSLLGDLT